MIKYTKIILNVEYYYYKCNSYLETLLNHTTHISLFYDEGYAYKILLEIHMEVRLDAFLLYFEKNNQNSLICIIYTIKDAHITESRLNNASLKHIPFDYNKFLISINNDLYCIKY